MRIWDSLFILLVIGPIVTGGVWLHGSGFRLEYTQPGVAALVLAAALYWLKKKGRDPARESLVCRYGIELWNRWASALRDRPLTTLLAGWAFVSLSWFLTSLLRHRAFGSGLADLGIFTNGIWNVHSTGTPYSSIKDGLSLLADHQNFLIYPIGWIFGLWPSPEFLLLLQAAGLSSGGIAFYLLARQRLGRDHPVIPWLPFAFWMCGPLRAAARFDFHPEVLMLPLFLFAAYLLQEISWRKRAAGFLCLLAALAAKESAGPVACGLGLAWILGAGPAPTKAFTRLTGAWVIVLGFIAFYFDSRIVPQLFGRPYSYGDLYAPLGTSPLALALAPFLHPLTFFGRIFSPSRIKFFFGALLPFGGLPLLAPLAMVAAVPGFLMLFLTNSDHRVSLGFHYAIEPMVGLLFAVPAALDSALGRKATAYLLPVIMLGTLLSFGRSDVYFWRTHQATEHQAWVRNEVLPFVKPERSVSASYALVPHVSTRRWVHQIPVLMSEHGAAADCVLWDRSVNNTPMGTREESDLAITLKMQEYERELSCGSFALYRKKNMDSCLSRMPACGAPQ